MENRVNAPAIALMITGILNGIYFIISLIAQLALGASVLLPEEIKSQMPSGASTVMQSALSVVFTLLWIIFSIFMVYGAMKMRSLENHTVAIIVSIVAMIPCFVPCCFVWAIPFGIWSLVVLLNPDVKACFRS